MAEKKITSDLRIEGKTTTSGVHDPAGGSNTEFWKTDGSKGEINIGSPSYNGFQYFKAAYKSGLTFLVTAEWRINGVLYLMRQQELTAPAADATNDRIDVIAVDDSGNIILIPGNPATSPIKPTVDPITQLEGTFFTVGANETTPSGTNITNIYYENLGIGGGEYNPVSTNARILINGTSINGTVGIDGTNAVSGDSVIFTPAASFQADTVTQLNYLIQNKSAVTGKGDTHRFILNGRDGAGNPVSITLLADPAYNQSILTPQFLSLTVPQDNSIFEIDNVQFAVTAKNAYGFLLDDIRFVKTEVDGIEGKYATILYVDERVNFALGKEIIQGVVTGTTSKTLTLTKVNGETVVIPFTDLTAASGSGHENINRIIEVFTGQLNSIDKAGIAQYLMELNPPIDNTDGKNLYIRLIRGNQINESVIIDTQDVSVEVLQVADAGTIAQPLNLTGLAIRFDVDDLSSYDPATDPLRTHLDPAQVLMQSYVSAGSVNASDGVYLDNYKTAENCVTFVKEPTLNSRWAGFWSSYLSMRYDFGTNVASTTVFLNMRIDDVINGDADAVIFNLQDINASFRYVVMLSLVGNTNELSYTAGESLIPGTHATGVFIPIGQWVTIALVISGSTTYIYVDKVLQYTHTGSSPGGTGSKQIWSLNFGNNGYNVTHASYKSWWIHAGISFNQAEVEYQNDALKAYHGI